MHVENVAVYDNVYESSTFHDVLSKAESKIENNLSQIAAVGAICNSATFNENDVMSSGSDEKGSHSHHMGIVGNATGMIINKTSIRILCIEDIGQPTDVAILRFSDAIVSANITRQRWVNVFRKNFNSKVCNHRYLETRENKILTKSS